MSTTVQSLSKLPFLSSLEAEALRDLASHVQQRVLAPGQMVVLEGEPCQSVYLVGRGLLRIRRLSQQGREQVLSYIGAGGSFNLVSALDGGASLATVDAVGEATVYGIPCEHFRRLIREHPGIAIAVSEQLATEVRRLSDLVESLALYTVRTRLARFLLSAGEMERPPRRWTQQEIAAHIGTVREMVGRTLRAFIDEGWVRRQRGRLVIVDRQGLMRVASGFE
jgi:CRP/FNR family cyclic AMP-dependent transcriptional regulator